MDTLTHAPKVAYLWAAEQTEPGLSDVRYDATNYSTKPAPIQPVIHTSGLIDAESIYSDWTLLGTIHATARRDAYGLAWLQLWSPLMHGAECDIATAVDNGWFQRAEA